MKNEATLIPRIDAPALGGPPQGQWTYDDWQTILPDDGNRYEIIDGVLHINGRQAVSGPPQGQWTYDDWVTLPNDGNRYEIMEGVLYVTPSRSSFHQWIVISLLEHFGVPARQQALAYSYIAPVSVVMPGCDPVQPDFVAVLTHNAHIIRQRRIFGIPDLIVEVLSPETTRSDTEARLKAYAYAGLPEYAVVDPRARTVTQYWLVSNGSYAAPNVVGETQTIAFGCLPRLSTLAGNLFAGAPDTML